MPNRGLGANMPRELQKLVDLAVADANQRFPKSGWILKSIENVTWPSTALGIADGRPAADVMVEGHKIELLSGGKGVVLVYHTDKEEVAFAGTEYFAALDENGIE